MHLLRYDHDHDYHEHDFGIDGSGEDYVDQDWQSLIVAKEMEFGRIWSWSYAEGGDGWN